MASIRLILFSFVFICVGSVFPCDPYMPTIFEPKDESNLHLSFASFKSKLENAIKEKNVSFLTGILDPQISFLYEENGNGKDAFLKFWKLNKNPTASPFWEKFGKTISFGFSKNSDGEQFNAPAFFSNLPNAVDPYNLSWVTGKNVNIRKEPSAKSQVIKKVSYEFLVNIYGQGKKKTGSEPCNWEKVCLADGSEGYICDEFIRSPSDFRVGFQKKKEKWIMIYFMDGSD